MSDDIHSFRVKPAKPRFVPSRVVGQPSQERSNPLETPTPSESGAPNVPPPVDADQLIARNRRAKRMWTICFLLVTFIFLYVVIQLSVGRFLGWLTDMRTFACVVCAFFGALAVYVWLYEHFVVMNDSDTMIQTTNTLATLLPVDADRSRIIQTAHAGGHTFKSPFDIIEPKNIADIDTITLDYKYGSTQGKKNSVKVRGSTVYLAWEMSFRAFVKNATAFFQNKLEGIKATLSRNAQSCNAGILAHLSDIDASQNLALISEMVMWCFRPTQRMIETGKRPSESPERTTQTETDQLTRMIDRLQVDPADRQYERGMTKESIKAGLKTTLLQLRNSYYSTMVDLGVIIESYSIYDLDLPVTRQKIQTNRASIADVKYQTAELLGLTSTKHEGGWEYEWYIMSTDPEKAGILQERLILVAQMLGVENLFTINSKGGKGGSPFVMPGMHQPSNSDKNPSEDPDDVN